MKQIFLMLIGLSLVVNADFTRDENTSIVTDSATGLEWQDNEVGTTATWQDAIDRCEDLTLDGKEDWRLPNINELTSLVDDTLNDTAINSVFQETQLSKYWSSTTITTTSTLGWSLHFLPGTQYKDTPKADTHYVRCVRDTVVAD